MPSARDNNGKPERLTTQPCKARSWGKKVFACFFIQLNFDLIIYSEIKVEYLIQMPAKAILFDWSDDPQEKRVRKELVHH